MRSFALALIAAALAPLACAAPVNPLRGVSPPTIGQVGSVEGKVKSAEKNVHARDTKASVANTVDGVEDKIHGLNTRAGSPSLAVVFSGLSTEIAPFVGQLTYIDSSNATVSQITNLVDSIKAPIVKAVPELQALVGAEVSVVLAPVSGVVELTVSDVAGIVGPEVEAILAGVGNVLEVVKSHVPDIVSDVEDLLTDLGDTVADLVEAVVDLVEGVAAPLVVELRPVVAVIGELHLTGLAGDLGIPL